MYQHIFLPVSRKKWDFAEQMILCFSWNVFQGLVPEASGADPSRKPPAAPCKSPIGPLQEVPEHPPSKGSNPVGMRVSWSVGAVQIFFKRPAVFFQESKRMSFKNKKYFLEVDEATFMKLQALAGKSYFQQKDFQQVVSTLISKAYENNKGKHL